MCSIVAGYSIKMWQQNEKKSNEKFQLEGKVNNNKLTKIKVKRHTAAAIGT